MIAIQNQIKGVITAQPKITSSNATKMLKRCGILNSKNQLKRAYKEIVVTQREKSNDR